MNQQERRTFFPTFGEIKHSQMEKLEQSITSIVKQVSSDWKVYDMIVVEGYSARVFGMVTGIVLDFIYRANGDDSPSMEYVNVPNSDMSSAVRKGIYSIKKIPKKALVVTEYASTGNTLSLFEENLTERNIQYDIAVLSANDEFFKRDKRYISPYAKLYNANDFGAALAMIHSELNGTKLPEIKNDLYNLAMRVLANLQES